MPSESTIKGIVAFADGLDGVDARILGEMFEIAHLHRQIEQVLESDLAGWGMSARQIEILESLFHSKDGGMTPADLADDVCLTRSAMTSALDSLEKLGHVTRSPHPSDRRMVVISLTPSGLAFLREHLPERYRTLFGIMNSLSDWERATLLRIYRRTFTLISSGMMEDRK